MQLSTHRVCVVISQYKEALPDTGKVPLASLPAHSCQEV